MTDTVPPPTVWHNQYAAPGITLGEFPYRCGDIGGVRLCMAGPVSFSDAFVAAMSPALKAALCFDDATKTIPAHLALDGSARDRQWRVSVLPLSPDVCSCGCGFPQLASVTPLLVEHFTNEADADARLNELEAQYHAHPVPLAPRDPDDGPIAYDDAVRAYPCALIEDCTPAQRDLLRELAICFGKQEVDHAQRTNGLPVDASAVFTRLVTAFVNTAFKSAPSLQSLSGGLVPLVRDIVDKAAEVGLNLLEQLTAARIPLEMVTDERINAVVELVTKPGGDAESALHVSIETPKPSLFAPRRQKQTSLPTLVGEQKVMVDKDGHPVPSLKSSKRQSLLHLEGPVVPGIFPDALLRQIAIDVDETGSVRESTVEALKSAAAKKGVHLTRVDFLNPGDPLPPAVTDIAARHMFSIPSTPLGGPTKSPKPMIQ